RLDDSKRAGRGMDNFVGTKLNSRRLARRAKGRMPEVSPLAAYAQLALVNEGTAGTRAREDCKETLLLTFGARGQSPASAATKWQLNQPGRAGIGCPAVSATNQRQP